MLKEKYDYEYEYARGMKKMYDLGYQVTTYSSLSYGIQAFRSDFLNTYTYSMEFQKNLQEDLIEPLKLFMDDQNNYSKKLNTDIKKLEKDFRDAADRLEKSRAKFHITAKSAEEIQIQCENAKHNTSFSTEQKNKLLTRSQNLLKEAKDAERSYITSLNHGNNVRDIYLEGTKRILTEFQNMEEKYIEFVKDLMRKYVIYQVSNVRNLQYDVDKKAKSMELINTQADIREFIELHDTNCLPPYKFEFIPYISDIHESGVETKENKNVFSNVKNFFSNIFFKEAPELDTDMIENKALTEITSILNLAWEGKRLSDDEKNIYLKYMKVKKHRRTSMTILNKFRTSGHFSLEANVFAILGELLLKTLDEIVKEIDYESAKTCIVLSQTFYKISPKPNQPRIFLQSAIETHQIWQNMEFWEGLIKYNINEELHNQKNYNMYTSESNDEKTLRIKNTAFSQLNSFIYNMLSFEIRKDRIRDLVMNFSKYHSINEEGTQQIFKNIEDYQYISENKINKNPVQSISSEDKVQFSFDEDPTNINSNSTSTTDKNTEKKQEESKETIKTESNIESEPNNDDHSEHITTEKSSDSSYNTNIILQQKRSEEITEETIDTNINKKIKLSIKPEKDINITSKDSKDLKDIRDSKDNSKPIDQNFQMSKVLENEEDEV